jgi:Fe-S-cluster-containing dehydrogenase component
MKAFVVDLAMCSGCYNCQIACKISGLGIKLRLSFS